jgi:hypothetical protein
MGTDVFISYSRGDGVFVERIHKLLSGAGVTTWFDKENLRPGMKWADVIENEIPEARIFLTCLSTAAIDERGYFQVEQQLAAKAAMRVPSDELFIIPVLLGDCTLPRELRQYHTVNLVEPGAIESLLSSISEALERPVEVAAESIDELRDALRKHLVAAGPFGVSRFSDKLVNDVVQRLRSVHEDQHAEFLNAHDLLIELDLLFNRKTFRGEALRRCPEQRWDDRLDSAYQTLTVLKAYLRNIRVKAPAKYPTYRDMVMAVDRYCMQMGALLFEKPVDYSRIEEHIGKSTFKAQLPQSIRFPLGQDKQPVILNEINDNIDPERVRAIALMDRLLQE